MASYSADIRVGITGKTQLNALERQLGRINKDLNKINKGLKAQTLTINTKAANRALDQLDRKINKLNRSINVNANINERRRSSGGGGGGGAAPVALAVTPAALRAAQQTKPIAEALTNEAQKQLDLGRERERQIGRLQDNFEQILKTRSDIGKLAKQQENIQNKGARSAAQIFGKGTTQSEGLKKVNAELVKARKYLDVLEDTQIDINNRVVEASRAQGQYNAKLREGVKQQEKAAAAAQKRASFAKKFNRGLGTGAGLAASSGLSGIPVLGDAATGGLVAGLSGGSVAGGAIGGLLAGGAVALAEFGAQAVKTATQVNKLRLSLELAAGSDFERSLETISTVVEDFNTPIENATTNFTKLYASAQGSGIAFADLSELFINLSAANKAFAGDAEDLNGILRAFTQIISKGTVQSEELKGQVGERLPGAFALAAQSLGMTTAQLQKALEKGEVKSKEFVEKFGRYMRKFRTDAAVIADAPEEAGARLTVALQNLQVETGKELARLGAQFQNFATEAIKALTRLYNFLGQLGDEVENRINKLGGNPTNDLQGYIQGLNEANDAIEQIQRNSLDPTRSNEAAKEDEANLKVWYQSRKDFQAKIDALKLGPPVPQVQPPPTVEDVLDKTKSGSGSKSGPRDITAELDMQIEKARTLLEIEKSRTGLTQQQLEATEFDRQRLEVNAELTERLKDIQLENITATSKIKSEELARLEAKRELLAIDNAQQQFEAAIASDIQQQITDLETQIAVEEAITDEMKEQAILAARIAEIQAGPGTEVDKKRLIDAEERLKRARDGNQGVSGYMKQLQAELMDTEAMIVSLAGTVETELASAMSTAIVGLIDGTTTAEEAFATMFKNIGQAFIDMATQMIAKALIMKALGILFPGSSNAGAYGTGAEAPLTGGLNFGSAFMRASGGPVAGNTPYLVGERGPELFVPSGGGNVINNADSRAALDRYTPNSAVNYSSSLSITTGPVMQMDNDQYIRREDFERGLRQASEDGAKRGEAMTLRRLKNSRSTRSTLGM